MKFPKTESYKNKKSQNFTKPLHTHTQTGINVHTKTYEKTKNTQFLYETHVSKIAVTFDISMVSCFTNYKEKSRQTKPKRSKKKM